MHQLPHVNNQALLSLSDSHRYTMYWNSTIKKEIKDRNDVNSTHINDLKKEKREYRRIFHLLVKF